MEINLADINVSNNVAQSRFEATVNGRTAFIKYRRSGETITFIHTEVPAELEGQGLAAKLTRAALDDARAKQLKVVALCPYVAGYIRKHAEYQDLLKT
jgi:predicted GNAT family acetyltransferase